MDVHKCVSNGNATGTLPQICCCGWDTSVHNLHETEQGLRRHTRNKPQCRGTEIGTRLRASGPRQAQRQYLGAVTTYE
jgi:hypothetical protein